MPLIDAAGNELARAPGARVASLVPSLTELMFDLGLGAQVVGRTHYCLHPADKLADVPSLGGTKKIRMDRLAEVGATHVLVNIDETPKELADEISASGCQVVVTHPNAPADNPALFRLLGGLFGAEAAAGDLCRRFEAALADLKAGAAARPRRRVLYLIWKDPWMTISRDTYISRLLGLVNWRTAGHDPTTRYPEIELDAVLARTDLVLLPSEPYAFGEADRAAMAAARAGLEVRLIDGEMTSWYGSRAIEGLKYLKRFVDA
jgi:ABC-type Fe3+-hydroxamate transport system substrate-binding protein